MKKMNKKIKILSLLGVLLFGGLASNEVLAFDCSSCAIFLPKIAADSSITSTASATTATSTAAMATAMATLDSYMMFGVGGLGSISSMGGGVVEQLQSINNTLSEMNQQSVDNGDTGDQLAKIRQYNLINNKLNASHLPTNFNMACSDISLGTAFGLGGSSITPTKSGIPNSKSPQPVASEGGNYNYIRDVIKDRNYTLQANAGSNNLIHNGTTTVALSGSLINFCTATQVSNHDQGCTSTGQYPGDDTSLQYLTQGAILSSDTSSIPVHTLNSTQKTVADTIINNIVPLIPNGLTKSQASTGLGLQYSSDANIVKSRVGVINTSLSDIAGLYTLREDLTSDEKSVWTGSETEFHKIYGLKALFPTLPSLYQQLDFEVQRRVADPDWGSNLASMDERSVMQEGVKLQLLQSQIEMQRLNQQVKTNELLSVIASSLIDPKSTTDLKSELSTISSSNSQ